MWPFLPMVWTLIPLKIESGSPARIATLPRR
jgi:hypothetical protein